jgi:UDP-glucose 4-epimerase
MRDLIKGSTVLITGGAGFIGSHLVDRIIKEEAKQVIIIDNMFLGNEDNLVGAIKNGAILFKDDAEFESSLDYIFNEYKVDIVFNCATKALNYSFTNPSNAYMTNVQVIKNLLEFQRKKAFKTLCHFSTSEVYGTAIYEPMDERHPLNPTTTYAAGKAAADIMLESYVRMFDLDSFIVRPFNNYGPRQNHKGPLAGIIPKTVFKILNGEQPEIHGTGLQSRDFIYVTDTIDAIVKVFNVLAAGESVNISTEGQITIKSLVENICDLLDYNSPLIYKEARKADVECHNASNGKIKSLINYSLTEFSHGLSETVEWYKILYNKMK